MTQVARPKAHITTDDAKRRSLQGLLEGLTPDQREAVEFPTASQPSHKGRKHLVIEAGAGAGKTHVLSRRAARLCLDESLGVSPSRLFLVTFSRAADRELRERVQRGLSQVGLETAARLVHVSTIDSLILSLVETRFPHFWEDAVRGLWADPSAIHRYSPPTVSILDEELVKEKLARRLEGVLETLASDASLARIVCDFLLSGALSRGRGALVPGGARNDGVLGGLLSAMLSEHMLCLDAPIPSLAAGAFHPALPRVLGEIRALARQAYAERLLKGTLTYTDASVFLYNLYCAPTEARAGSVFDTSVPADFPVAPEELVVDEYQDTSRIQHEILLRLATHKGGRMVVVGDPKQSIYGFRNAHVEVMEGLKRDPLWRHVELKQNFRSDPRLLEEINVLSELAFGWRDRDLPPDFAGSPFETSAQSRRVEHNPLSAGRPEQGHPERARVEILSASLGNKERPGPEKAPTGALREYLWKVFCDHVSSRGQVSDPIWSDVAILCERNEHVRETARRLREAGVPATALVSSSGRDDDLRRVGHLRATLFLLQALHRDLGSVELFEVFCSAYADVPWDECVAFFSEHGSLAPRAFFSTAPESFAEGPAGTAGAQKWPCLRAFHARVHSARACAPVFSFQAWQGLRMAGRVETASCQGAPSMELALGDEFALQFSAWCCARSALEAYEDLPSTLEHWRVKAGFEAQAAGDPNAVQIMTIHAAKGLEWPHVYFWPQARKRRVAKDFELVSHGRNPLVKWLPSDRTTLGVLPWCENETAGPTSATVNRDKAEVTVHFADLQKELEEGFERRRVFYTAFTRARESLTLIHPLPAANARNSLRDKLGTLQLEEKGAYGACGVESLEESVLAGYLDANFVTGHARLKGEGRKSVRSFDEPWCGPQPACASPIKPWVRFTEPSGIHWDPSTLPVPHSDSEGELQDESAGESVGESAGEAAQESPEESAQEAGRGFGVTTETPFDAEVDALGEVATSPHRWLWNWTAMRVPIQAPTDSNRSARTARPAARLRGRAELNPYYARRMAAAEGVLYHARQEVALDANNPARTLRRAALRTWQELEIWHHMRESDPPGVGPLIPAPARNILDFLCYVEAAAFPRDLVDANVRERLDALAPDALIACVLDFKTGLPKPEHDTQLEGYLRLAEGLVAEGFGLPRVPNETALMGLLVHDLASQEASTRAEHLARLSKEPGVVLGQAYFVRARLTTAN